MTKYILRILLPVSVVGVGYVIYSQNKIKPSDKNTNNVASAQCGEGSKKEQASSIESGISQYASSTKDLTGKSTEGGQQIDYYSSDGKNRLIKQTFFGEAGKSEVNYYLDSGKVFHFTRKNYIYELPLSQDSNGKIKSIESNEFFLSADQGLCSWYSDGQVQENTQAAKDTVSFVLTDFQ